MTYDLTKLGIEDLNLMQQEMLQEARRHSDIVLLSPTGSGKTLAYLLPILESMDASSEDLQTIVLVPSRELAIQTCEVVKRLCPEARPMACYGGRAAMDEHRTLRGLMPRMVIATPGRMLDHIQKENVLTTTVRTLVIDEFDKSLELGFQAQMEAIIQSLASVKKHILLSATDCPQIPLFVNTTNSLRLSYLDENEQVPERISLRTVLSPEKDKLSSLYNLLCSLGTGKSLVFVNYRQSVERVGEYLQKMNVYADTFHGGMEQRDRERALYRFSNGSCNVFVSTDLASRGLDIPDVDNVIHYHLPLDEEAYIHRNGRTARWDACGNAYMILGPEEHLPEYITGETEEYTLPSRVPSPAKPEWVTLYIGKGKKDKISRGDVAGFLSKAGGLQREQIGRIDVLPGWCYVAVAEHCSKRLLQTIKGQKIKGVKTIFAIAD